MEPRLILPKSMVRIRPDERIFFTAGPIWGGGDWQKKAIMLFAEQAPEAYIACPCRYGPGDELYRFSLQGESALQWQSKGLPPLPNGTLWERYYLALAAKQGAILFWLPEEDRDNPRPKANGPYAQDSYGELGEWRARMAFEGARVVIGAQPGFPGLQTMLKNYRAMTGDGFIVHETLESTVRAAISPSGS